MENSVFENKTRSKWPHVSILNDGAYQHPGWLGEPYFSDFHSRWGIIKLDEILDCSHIPRTRDAGREAQRQGFKFFFSQSPSRYGSWLYIVDGADGRCNCVYGKLVLQAYNASISRQKYKQVETRIRHLIRSARLRARQKKIGYDLDEDAIVQRVMAGKCEATGVPLFLEFNESENGVRNPFMPSIDRIDSRLGYTMDNVRVVCLVWNLMKSNFDEHRLTQFIDGWLANRAAGVLGITS